MLGFEMVVDEKTLRTRAENVLPESGPAIIPGLSLRFLDSEVSKIMAVWGPPSMGPVHRVCPKGQDTNKALEENRDSWLTLHVSLGETNPKPKYAKPS